jgi:predicted ATPase
MLIALELENFKGISTRQRIEFAPITLLFGKNSAGKSTILQALLYLHEVLTHGEADVHRSALGGTTVDLGGFERLIHKHDLTRTMRIKAEFAISQSVIPRSFADLLESADCPFPDFDDDLKSAWIEIEIRHVNKEWRNGPCVTHAYFGMNDGPDPMTRMCVGPNLSDGEPIEVAINMTHDLLGGSSALLDYDDADPDDDDFVPHLKDEITNWLPWPSGDMYVMSAVRHTFAGQLRDAEQELAIASKSLAALEQEYQDISLDCVRGDEVSAGELSKREREVITEYGDLKEKEKVARRTLLATQSRNDNWNHPAGGLGDWQGWDDKSEAIPYYAIARDRVSALPNFDRPPGIVTGEIEVDGGADSAIEAQLRLLRLSALLDMMIYEPCRILRDWLHDAIYIGPLRAMPRVGDLQRILSPEGREEWAGGAYPQSAQLSVRSQAAPGSSARRHGRGWADGLAGWRMLANGSDSLVEHTNKWLDELGVGLNLFRQTLHAFEPDENGPSLPEADNHISRVWLHSASAGSVMPHEVGVGVAQIMPVIVAAHEVGRGLCMIEQPELHVHPALQLGVGDLLIDAAIASDMRGIMLVETHSEHLILRLLRRIREAASAEQQPGEPGFCKEHVSVLYVGRADAPEGEGDVVSIERLRVDAEGDFVDEWPAGFFEDRDSELF